MGSVPHQSALVQHQNPVRLGDGGDPLGNDELGGARQQGPEGGTDGGVGGHIHRGGGVVQNQDPGLFQNGPGDTQPLPLTSREVAAALTEGRIIALRQLFDKSVGTGGPAGLPDLRLRGLRVPPEQAIPQGPGKEHTGLGHKGDGLPQLGQGIGPDILAPHQQLPAGNIVEPGNQGCQGGLAGAGGPDDPHGLARWNGEAQVLEEQGTVRVGKVHMGKGDGPILRRSPGTVRDGRVPLHHLQQPLEGDQGPGEHHGNIGQHNDPGENLGQVGAQPRQLSHRQVAHHHVPAAVPVQQHRAQIQNQIPQGGGQDGQAHGLIRGPEHLAIAFGEHRLLLLLPAEHLDESHGDDILLDHLVELVDALLHPLEQGPQSEDHQQHRQQHQGDQRHEHPGQVRGDHKAEHRRKDQHTGGPNQVFDGLDGGGLDGGHVGGEPGDEGGGTEGLQVLEGEILHFTVGRRPEARPQAQARPGGVFHGVDPCRHHAQGHQGHHQAVFHGIAQVRALDAPVHNGRHDQGDQQGKQGFQPRAQGAEPDVPAVGPEVGGEFSEHDGPPSIRQGRQRPAGPGVRFYLYYIGAGRSLESVIF